MKAWGGNPDERSGPPLPARRADRGRWSRRAVTVPLGVLGWLGIILTLPLTVSLAVLLDVARGRRRMPSIRLVGFVLWWSLITALVMGAGAGLWLAAIGGRRLHRPGAQRAHHELACWWFARVDEGARRFLGLRFEVDHHDGVPSGPALVISRHASYGDAVLPALLFATRARLALRYVLMAELRWEPSLDLIGQRLPNHFIDREPDDPGAELDALRRLGTGLGPGEVAVIFPEGRFHTPARRDRALAAIERVDPKRAERVASLRHLLPIRPGGTLAILEGAERPELVVMGHVGLEGFGSLAEIWRNVPLRRPVQVHTWRVSTTSMPDGFDDATAWLDARWAELDAWIASNLAASSGG